MQNSNSRKRFFECETANGQAIRFRVNRRKKTASIIRIALTPETGSVVIPGTMYADDIPYTVTAIGNRAFWGCHSLTSVTVPAGVTTIRYDAFKSSKRLTSIHVDGKNPKYSSEAGVLFDKNKTTFRYPQGKTGSYTLPDSVTTIGNWAFFDCKSLTSVTIPNSVAVIGIYAFSRCHGFISVIIPAGVTVIDHVAFGDCESLTSITIPDSATVIGGYAFSSCENLAEIHNRRATPQKITAVFEGVNKQTCTLYVPESAVAVYKSAPVWKSFANIVREI
ncbi:MAG: leucine-rich repeat domain-containing protein [Prevotellaceae bacterium]|nr:leucine-rich repeat domain-containing protein [Prevotellaceae bacterium]